MRMKNLFSKTKQINIYRMLRNLKMKNEIKMRNMMYGKVISNLFLSKCSQTRFFAVIIHRLFWTNSPPFPTCFQCRLCFGISSSFTLCNLFSDNSISKLNININNLCESWIREEQMVHLRFHKHGPRAGSNDKIQWVHQKGHMLSAEV